MATQEKAINSLEMRMREKQARFEVLTNLKSSVASSLQELDLGASLNSIKNKFATHKKLHDRNVKQRRQIE